MIAKVSDNIISPLGMSTRENFESVLAGKSALHLHSGCFGLPEPFVGSLLEREQLLDIFATGFPENDLTFFEKLCILSASDAIASSDIDPAADDTLFVLSTTKGNVAILEQDIDSPQCFIGHTATRIAGFFGNKNQPIVVSNACISGICAQIAAIRALLSKRARHAIVIGADVLSRFIVSGFQSFKALSPDTCAPYDANRCGLNLGEAAATIILEDTDSCAESDWHYLGGSINNDANHISGPSRTGEGAFRVLNAISNCADISHLAFINTHGTATRYNDEMESIALHRAGLSEIPISGLKGFYGHTLGAAGVMETILSMQAVDSRIVMPTRGFHSQGTTHAVNVSSDIRRLDNSKDWFIKLLSGFGGSNAGIAYGKGGVR